MHPSGHRAAGGLCRFADRNALQSLAVTSVTTSLTPDSGFGWRRNSGDSTPLRESKQRKRGHGQTRIRVRAVLGLEPEVKKTAGHDQLEQHQAQGSIGPRHRSHDDGATDSFMEQSPGDAGRRNGKRQCWQQRGRETDRRQKRREGSGRGDAARLWTRGRLRRVTAPEGRARENERSGRPRRLRAAGPWHCALEGRDRRRKRTSGETRVAAHPISQQPAHQPRDFGPAMGEQLQTPIGSGRGLALSSLQQWRAARSPTHRAACFGTQRGGMPTRNTEVSGPTCGGSGAVQHGRVLRKECTHRVDGVDAGP